MADPYAELHRKAGTTSGARFQAARRLSRHARLSQWTIALLSLGLIIISVMQAVGLLAHVASAKITVILVGDSALVLVFSLLIGLENYAVRADKSHRCGIELGNLARKLEPRLNEPFDQSIYTGFNDEYYHILNQYENHEHTDYLLYKLQDRVKNYPRFWRDFVPAWLRAQGGYWISFWPYILLLILSVVALIPLIP